MNGKTACAGRVPMSSQPPSRRTDTLTRARIAELAERPDTVVYEPTYDTVFEPWDAARVRRCVRRMVASSRRHGTTADAQRALADDAEVCEFQGKYQTMYAKLTDPAFVRNEHHVGAMLSMIDIREQFERGEVDERRAHQLSGEAVLGRLLVHAREKADSTSAPVEDVTPAPAAA